MAGWEERVGERFRGWAVFGEVLGAEGGEAVGLIVPRDAGVTRDPAGLDGEGSCGEHGEDLLKEVAEFGVMAEALAEGVNTNLAVREDDTKAGRGSLRRSEEEGDGHTHRPGFTKIVGPKAEAGGQPNRGETRLQDEGARSRRAWVGRGGAISVDNRTSRRDFADELGSVVLGSEELSRGALGGLSKAFWGGSFGGIPDPNEIKGGGSDQRNGGGSANPIHNTTNSDPNRVAEGYQEGETIEGGAAIGRKVGDENWPRNMVNET